MSVKILPALLGKRSEQPIREAIVHHSGDGLFSIRQGKWKLILGLGALILAGIEGFRRRDEALGT